MNVGGFCPGLLGHFIALSLPTYYCALLRLCTDLREQSCVMLLERSLRRRTCQLRYASLAKGPSLGLNCGSAPGTHVRLAASAAMLSTLEKLHRKCEFAADNMDHLGSVMTMADWYR